MATVPANFTRVNAQQSKVPVLVVTIAGVNDIFSNVTTVYKTPRYGDAGLTYGQSGLLYGDSLVSWATSTGYNVRDYLIMDQSSAVISQKIEPEQGKGSITTFTISFLDKNGYMTQLCSPGIVLTEMLGNEVNVYLGYQTISYPEDYVRVFRGYVSDITSSPGTIALQISDPGFKKQQNIFNDTTTTVSSIIGSGDTTINVASNGDFYAPILNINGSYDSAIACYVQIDNEYIQYPNTGVGVNQYTSVTRGATLMGVTSVAASHSVGATVTNFITIQDTAINIALKIMLSGWDGNWITGVACSAFNNMLDPATGIIPGSILLPTYIDAVRDYGLAVGDQVTVAGDVNAGQTGIITGFSDAFGQSNRCIVTGGTFTTQTSTTSTLAFRSQYDAYPIVCGMSMTPKDVDVAQHQYLANNFLTNSYYQYQFWFSASTDGKSFLETDVYLPIGAYACTRQGRASVVYTKPPFGSSTVQILDQTNVLKPDQIKPFRSTNKRRFFNNIQYSYDYDLDQNFDTVTEFADSTSIALIKESDLPIDSQGLRTALGAATLVSVQGVQLLNLFKRCATQVDIQTTFGVAAQIEIGDPVIVNDNGNLQIANFLTGTRNLGSQTFTVIGRELSMTPKDSSGKLTLMTSASGFLPTDRFASIAPSSVLGAGTTQTTLVITDSYGPEFPNQEYKKWQNYVGLRIWVHSTDYTTRSDQGGTFLGFVPGNKYQLMVSGLSVTPQSGDILELHPYSSSTLKSDQAAAKSAHAFMNPSLTVVTGVSSTSFTLSSGDAAKVQVGLPVIVHSSDYTTTSTEVTVKSVVSTTITVASTLGFTPSAGQIVDLVGFVDGGQPYRWV